MIKRLINFLKKYHLIVISASIVVFIGVIVLIIINFYNNDSLKVLDTENYVVEYDRSWKVKEQELNSVLLKHKNSNSFVKIDVIPLESEFAYFSIDDLIDEIIYNIDKQNKNYKLISKQEDIITDYQYRGYKMLYEVDNLQTMVATYKKSDKLIMISYESVNDYFDILLDSVHNIIYHFDTKEKQFNLTGDINLNLKKIKFSKGDKVEKLLSKVKNYEVADNNYYVSYSIPDNFQLGALNSRYQYFELEGLEDGNLTMNVNIYNWNIYEYLDKKNSLNVFDNYEMFQKDEDYSEFQESIEILDSDYDSYIYKNSYYYDKATIFKDNELKEYRRRDENIELIYALNKNHILVIKLSSSGVGIPEKLINMINIEKSKNYASYVKSNKKDGYLVAELQRFKDYRKDKIESITIRLPDKYDELDRLNNFYEKRVFSLNYDEEKEIYDYEIEYQLTTISDINSLVDIINNSYTTSYGPYDNLSFIGNVTVNNKDFIEYSGGYTNLGGIMFTDINRFKYYVYKKALFYRIGDEGYLMINISGNNHEISDDIINEVTNFVIEEKSIKKRGKI